MQLSDFILSKYILNVILDVKRIESKKRLQVIACSEHDLLGASRVHFDKVSDVIDSIPECDPNPVFQALMLLQVALAVHKPNLRLGFFTFCFLKPFIQVSKQSCTRCSIQKVSRQICSIFFLIVIIFPKRHGQKSLLLRSKLGAHKSSLRSLSESG